MEYQIFGKKSHWHIIRDRNLPCLPNSRFTFGEPIIEPENSDIDGKVLEVKPFNVADVGVNAVKGVVLLVNNPVKEYTPSI